MNTKYLTLILVIIITSCQKENNCGPVSFEKQFLTEESKSYFLYDAVDKAIFIDIDSIEYEFSIIHSGFEPDNFAESVPCGDYSQSISFERESKKVTLIGPDQGHHSITLNLTTDFLHDETNYDENHLVDVLHISHSRIPEGGGGSIIILPYFTSNRGGMVNMEVANDSYSEIESFEIFGRNFGSVIVSKTVSNTWEPIYYSQEQGIVALFDVSHKLLVLDRFE